MKALLRTLIHAALGGIAAGLATIPAGAPITAKTVLFPALASAATSIISLLANNPFTPKPNY